jgi:hypothetical protein
MTEVSSTCCIDRGELSRTVIVIGVPELVISVLSDNMRPSSQRMDNKHPLIPKPLLPIFH